MVVIRKPIQRSENIVDRRLEGAEHARALVLHLQRLQKERLLREAREAKAQGLILQTKIRVKR